MARVPIIEEQTGALILNMEGAGLSSEQFFQLCLDNPELHLELSARKELVIMTLPGGKTGLRNTGICTQLTNWSQKTGSGPVFGPLTLFVLPNGAMRAPDGRAAGECSSSMSGFRPGVDVTNGQIAAAAGEDGRIP
jgi:hypothetical protein